MEHLVDAAVEYGFREGSAIPFALLPIFVRSKLIDLLRGDRDVMGQGKAERIADSLYPTGIQAFRAWCAQSRRAY